MKWKPGRAAHISATFSIVALMWAMLYYIGRPQVIDARTGRRGTVTRAQADSIARFRELQDRLNTRRYLIDTHQLQIGMNESTARLVAGEPKSVNRTVTASGTLDQWVMGPNPGGYQYVYLQDGVVASWQE